MFWAADLFGPNLNRSIVLILINESGSMILSCPGHFTVNFEFLICIFFFRLVFLKK